MNKECINCKWSTKRSDLHNLKCIAPQNNEINNADDNYSPRWIYCSTQRTHGWFGAMITYSCGKSGRWWEPKVESSFKE